MPRPGGWLSIAAAALGLLLAAADVERERPRAPAGGGPSAAEQLARARCSSCHGFIPPEALTREGWAPGLAHMVARLGLARDLLARPPADFTPEDQRQVRYHVNKMQTIDRVLVPSEPLVSRDEFLTIRRYLLDTAPETPLPQSGKSPVSLGATPFRLGPRQRFELALHLAVTLVAIDARKRRVFAGGLTDADPDHGASSGYLSLLDPAGSVLDTLALRSPPVGLVPLGRDLLLTAIGSMATVQSARGELLRLSLKQDKLHAAPILEGLVRPAGAAIHERRDGGHLVALNGFGYYLGGLELLEERRGAITSRRTLLAEPGPLQTRFGDFDGDGRIDLLCLVSQYRESLMLFRDDGFGGYEPLELLRMHPAWGLSSFDLADFDGDGRPELVVSNGDNHDYPDAPLKGYHGVRIYRDTATGHAVPRYEPIYFQPVHGAFKVLARDFDLDHDVDLAVIARLLDETAKPRENFVYLDNRSAGPGALQFAARALKELEASDFYTMAMGDLDGDGDDDLVLGGSHPVPGLRRRSSETPLGLVYLINDTRRARTKEEAR